MYRRVLAAVLSSVPIPAGMRVSEADVRDTVVLKRLLEEALADVSLHEGAVADKRLVLS